MDLQARLSGRMEQGMALLPKMLQSIEVLQLASADLLSLIDQELAQNETLTAERPEGPDGSEGERSPAEGPAEDTERYDDFEAYRVGAVADGEDTKHAFLNNVADEATTLADHVAGQLGFLELSDEILAGVQTLAEHLDDRGLLSESDADLLHVLDQQALDQCLEVLQSLEPRGIGARGPIEAMLLQIAPDDPDRGDIEAMLTVHLDALSKNKLPEVGRALGRPVDEVQALLGRIKKLDPNPGSDFASRQGTEAVHPDVTVRLVGDRIELEIDDMVLPDLGILPDYQVMAADASVDRDTRRYLKDKLRSARELITAVAQRKRTLGRVTLAIMNHQRAFLEQGSRAVQPLCMETISEEVELHPSTVSRAIAGKYAQTDHGIFRLRDFFDGDRRQAKNGAGDQPAKGRMAVKDHVRDLIAAEDKQSPLSDDELVGLLEARGIAVARRTVAKYRKELGLPSSWRRRAF